MEGGGTAGAPGRAGGTAAAEGTEQPPLQVLVGPLLDRGRRGGSGQRQGNRRGQQGAGGGEGATDESSSTDGRSHAGPPKQDSDPTCFRPQVRMTRQPQGEPDLTDPQNPLALARK